ncbi:MAG: protein kinase [Myxococcales bacterium]|nr:protein kinase [Myxococcales bacterium]MCB9578825.1 protein kinase [Polyangiaceae bacterium]
MSSDDDTVGMVSWGSTGAAGTQEHTLLSNRYELLGLLGTGGMGSVYRARDRELAEIVALKMLKSDLTESDRAIERFRREVKLARRVTHVNVARTFDIGEHDGQHFLTMEYVDGESLASIVAREGRLSPQRAGAIATAVCAGLAAAHAVGIIHRDLKPDNVMLERGGRVVITDFGVATVREDHEADGKTLGGVVGTPAYMAPEQVEGARELDGRADVYALGVMLFEMLTGELPFCGQSAYSIAAARLTQEAPDPSTRVGDLPLPLAQIVRRCMARERHARFDSVDQVAVALSALAPTLDEPIASVPQPRAPDNVTQDGDKTLAVLPFRSSAEDRDLADGLMEDLIDNLSMTPGLRVRPRGVVMAYRGEDADPRHVGRELQVEVVVDASLRRAGDSVRITVRLMSVADGFQLWAKRFDGEKADLFSVSDEAASAIADALTVEGPERQRSAPKNARAVELYLEGRAHYHRLWQGSVERSVRLLAEAEALAPDDPSILSAHARARARQWYQEGGVALGRQARALAERALAKAPERGEPWLSVASVRTVELDLESAARHARQALERAPALAEAHELYADLLLEAGDIDGGVARHRLAASLEPALRNRFAIARALGLAGRWSEVDTLLGVPPEDDDARISAAALGARLALWHPESRERVAALPDLGGAPEINAVHYVRLVQSFVARGSLSPEERAFVHDQFVRGDETPRFVAFKHQLAAEISAWVANGDAALRHLEALAGLGFADLVWLERCPLLEPLAARPELEGVKSRIARANASLRGALDLP